MRFLELSILILLFTQFSGMLQDSQAQQSKVQIANVSKETDEKDFEAIRTLFKEKNAGYDMEYLSLIEQVEAKNSTRVIFVQEIGGVTNQDVLAEASVYDKSEPVKESETIVGDILIVQPGERVQFNSKMGLLVFTVPEEAKQDLPSFIRPDWDPNITDVPGGCATDIDAYRRILLTWQEEVGEYIYHAINSHRVRIYDSFSHYHPLEGGFDEFYLVQMVKPGAKLITSEKVELINNPEQLDRSDVGELIDEYELEVGDLIYLPRGVMHRGYGGVLAQVITIPGFIPGSEIGVDHHLRAINERFCLSEEDALFYNEEHSHEPVIR